MHMSRQKLEKRIKRKLGAHLRTLGFVKSDDGKLAPPEESKDVLRAMHRIQRRDKLRSEKHFLDAKAERLLEHFASGKDVNPAEVRPKLKLVTSNTLESDLFRFASLTWSVPVSRGYGRRMRFLVMDQSNGKVIGLIALGDPVFNMSVRDNYIGWTSNDRKERLVDILDAYVLGAIPPYSFLLGGKLVASLIRTKEIQMAFRQKYGDTKGIISSKKKHASLVMVTTSSALGRSSLYNRLKLNGTEYYTPIGYTNGWGHFHVPDSLFADMRRYLEKQHHAYSNGHQFGDGPNWRLRSVRTTLDYLGIDGNILRHGVPRQVYICKLASNAERILRGETHRPIYSGLKSVAAVGDLARERWLVPRATRRPEYAQWEKEQILNLIR